MYAKSPIHYMGNKYDLLPYLIEQFPKKEEIKTFYDIFGGSGTISLNVPYDNIIYNELNYNMVELFNMVKNTQPKEIINHIHKRIKEFDLNPIGTDIRGKDIDQKIVKYYKDKYLKFRKFYNECENKDVKDLYTLSFYSFCNLIRFNSNNEFNMPYGNRCYLLDKDTNRLIQAHEILNRKHIYIYNLNAFDILKSIKENKGQFIYLDPPYQNSTAIYNEKGWGYEDDERLFNELDRLTKLGIKWAYSNVLSIKGKNNSHIEQWAIENNYNIIDFEQKQYSSIGKGNAQAREVLIINYEQRTKKYSIFDFGVEL